VDDPQADAGDDHRARGRGPHGVGHPRRRNAGRQAFAVRPRCGRATDLLTTLRRRLPIFAFALLSGVGTALAVSACGSSGSKTVATRTVTVTTPTPAGAPTSTSTVLTNHGTDTVTLPEPGSAPSAGGLAAAETTVRQHGYTPTGTGTYRSDQTLRVLVGVRTGSGDGYNQLAFFFVRDRYIGTDTKDPSAGIAVVSQGDTQVTLRYPLYRPDDPNCCPSGGQRAVTYVLDNGRLEPRGSIPSASRSAPLSRR
jgi:hypothetical protein